MMYLDKIDKSIIQKYKATDFDLNRLLGDTPSAFDFDEKDILEYIRFTL
jgi:hypothetical protein